MVASTIKNISYTVKHLGITTKDVNHYSRYVRFDIWKMITINNMTAINDISGTALATVPTTAFATTHKVV